MSKIMDQEKLKALAEELAKDIKPPDDLSTLSAQLTKLTVEAALNGEMEYHLLINSQQFPSNWELSVIRTTTVSHYMIRRSGIKC